MHTKQKKRKTDTQKKKTDTHTHTAEGKRAQRNREEERRTDAGQVRSTNFVGRPRGEKRGLSHVETLYEFLCHCTRARHCARVRETKTGGDER